MHLRKPVMYKSILSQKMKLITSSGSGTDELGTSLQHRAKCSSLFSLLKLHCVKHIDIIHETTVRAENKRHKIVILEFSVSRTIRNAQYDHALALNTWRL